MTLAGRTALVTGAASGIGRAVASLLSSEGALTILADVELDAAEEIAAGLRAGGGEARALFVDVADEASVEAAVSASGPIDVLIHCAAIGPNGSALALDEPDWRRVLAVNLDGTFFLTRAVGRGMSERGSGAIVLLASDRGVTGMRNGAAYAASKGGVIAYGKSLALELAAHGVTVNLVNPGTTDTPMARSGTSDEEWAERERRDPLGRLSTPEEIARLVLYLVTAGGFMTGQVVTTRMREI